MKIGFCGTGIMGSPMVRCLLAAGYEVHVWNRTFNKIEPLITEGAIAEHTPATLASAVDMVCLCLQDETAIESVVFGPQGISETRDFRYLVDHSTISPESTKIFSQRLADVSDAIWIDAPVSGGVSGAKVGTLIIMAGGLAQAVDEVTPFLHAYANQVTYMGPVGAGQTTKMCNQIIVAANVMAIAEAICLADNCGIDAQRLPKALSGGLADSKVLQIFAPRMTQPTTDKTGTIAMMLKDINIVAELGKKAGTMLPMTIAIQRLLQKGITELVSDPDLWEIIKIYRTSDCLMLFK